VGVAGGISMLIELNRDLGWAFPLCSILMSKKRILGWFSSVGAVFAMVRVRTAGPSTGSGWLVGDSPITSGSATGWLELALPPDASGSMSTVISTVRWWRNSCQSWSAVGVWVMFLFRFAMGAVLRIYTRSWELRHIAVSQPQQPPHPIPLPGGEGSACRMGYGGGAAGEEWRVALCGWCG